MGLHIFRNIKRVGLALALVAASAFAVADDRQAGTIAQWGRTTVASGTSNVVACASAIRFDGGDLADSYVALMKNGTVMANGVSTGLTGITAISAGTDYFMALRADGTIAIGDLIHLGVYLTPPASVHDVVSISAGIDSFIAVRSDGGVVHWRSDNYIYGDTPAADPVNPVTKAVMGAYGSVFLRKDGTVSATGSWFAANSFAPIVVPSGLTGVVDISMSSKCAIALKSDHTVACFGPQGQEAQLRFPGENYEAIGSGYDYTMAIQNDGSTRTLRYFCLQDLAEYTDNSAILEAPAGLTPLALGDGVASMTPMVVVPSFDGRVTVNGSNLIGGSTQRLTATVTLNSPATDDRYLTIEGARLYTPDAVKVAKGKRSATFYVYAHTTKGLVFDSLFVDGAWAAVAHIYPNVITNLKFTPSTVEGGQGATGTVTVGQALKDGDWLDLRSDNPNVEIVEGGVVIPVGSKTGTFVCRTHAVTETTQVTITAKNGDFVAWSGKLTLQPRPVVRSVSLAGSMYGHQKITGTVTLVLAAGSAGATVTISGDGLTVDGTVTIPAGSRTGTFSVTADDPEVSTLHHLTFSTATSVFGKDLTVKPNPLASITLSASSVLAGNGVTGTVTLAQPVAVDTVVALESTKPAIAGVPATVTIRAGSSSATFPVTTVANTRGTLSIVATKNATVKRATLTVTR